MAEPYKPPLPHPGKVVPKIVLIIAAILVFGHLFWNLGKEAEAIPHPVRVSLAHAEKGFTGEEALRSGLVLISPLEAARTPRNVRMDLPLGSEAGALTYNARVYREQNHLGDDLNGIGGQNSDLGDPVYASANGLVIHAANTSAGWGNVVIVQHRRAEGELFQTLYAHLDVMRVSVGDQVTRGQVIGTVGTAFNQYLAHLHLELRNSLSLDVGGGYSPFPLGRKNPEEALRELRSADPSLLNPSFSALKPDLESLPEVELKGLGEKSNRFELE